MRLEILCQHMPEKTFHRLNGQRCIARNYFWPLGEGGFEY